MNPLKILYIVPTLDRGGSERQLVELAKGLNRERFVPVVCCLSSGGPLASELIQRGIKVKTVPMRNLSLLYDLVKVIRRFGELVEFIGGEKPEIVHGFLFYGYILGTFAARLARVPIVISGRRSLGNFKASKRHCLFVERIVNRLTDVVIANSEAVRQDAIRQERLPADKVMLIYNGLEANRFRVPPDERLRQSLQLPEGAPVVGIVANFIHYKGHDCFLESWPSVLREFPDGVALLVGDGPLLRQLKTRVEVMGLSKRVRFLGSRQEVPALLALMDLVVHPSLEEGLSNAILEAMAAGKPVVAADVGGNPEAVVHGETGLLVPPGDSEALARAMLWLLERPAEAAGYGEAGRRRVGERFGLSPMISMYEAAYERLAAEKCPDRTHGGSPRAEDCLMRQQSTQRDRR